MDGATAKLLGDLVRKEGRSLLQYVSESYPWTTAKTDWALPVLLAMAKEEQDGTAGIVRLLLKERLRPPYLGAYPMSFTTINYMSLDFLIPYLVEFQKRRCAELQSDLATLAEGEARELVKGLLEMKERHLAALINLGATEKPAA